MQGVDLDEVRAEGAARPGGELGEVGEVPHAPGAGGQQGVELHEEAVTTPGGRGEPAGRDDQGRGGGPPVRGLGAQDVAARRERLGAGPLPGAPAQGAAVLGVDAQPRALGELGQGAPGALAQHHRRRQQPPPRGRGVGVQRVPHGPGGGGVDAQRGEDRDHGVLGHPHGLPRRGLVGGGDTVQLGKARSAHRYLRGRPRAGCLCPTHVPGRSTPCVPRCRFGVSSGDIPIDSASPPLPVTRGITGSSVSRVDTLRAW